MKRFLALSFVVFLPVVSAISQDQDNLPAPGDYVSVAAVDSLLAAASRDRLTFFQVDREAENPVAPVHQLPFDETFGSIQLVVSEEDTLYVIHSTNIAVVEIGEKSPPRVIGTVTLRGPVKGLGRIDSHLYAACLPSELVVIDIADPSTPKTMIRVPTRNRPTGLIATENRVLIRSARQSTEFFDVSNPQLPKPVATIESLDPFISPSPGLAYAWSRQTIPGRVVSFAVDNVNRSSELPLPDENVPVTGCVADTTVYISDQNGRIFVLDTSGTPTLSGCLYANTPTRSIAFCEGFLFAVDRGEGDLVVLDTRDLEPCPEIDEPERPPLPLARRPTGGVFPPIDGRGILPVQIPSIAPPNVPEGPVAESGGTTTAGRPPGKPAGVGAGVQARSSEGHRTLSSRHGDDPGLYPMPKRIIMDPQGRVFVDYSGESRKKQAQSPLKTVTDLPFKGFSGTRIRGQKEGKGTAASETEDRGTNRRN